MEHLIERGEERGCDGPPQREVVGESAQPERRNLLLVLQADINVILLYEFPCPAGLGGGEPRVRKLIQGYSASFQFDPFHRSRAVVQFLLATFPRWVEYRVNCRRQSMILCRADSAPSKEGLDHSLWLVCS
jgi:hypothetical protein